MKPPRLFAKRAGAVAGAGVALTLISLLFDAAPLFVPAIALVLIGAAAPAWVWISARGAHAQRNLQAERVVEEQPLAATIEVRRGRLGLPGVEVVDPFTGSRLELGGPLSALSGGRVAEVRVVTRFPRRGLQTLAPPSLLVRDPLELAHVESVSAAPPQKLLVLPRTEPIRWLTTSRGRRLQIPEGLSPAEAFAAVDVDGLRPYRPGTPASRIHWPAVARGAGLIERRLQADGDTRPLVVLDARGAGGPELDAAVRAAASLTLELARSGGCGLLLPGEQRATGVDRELATWPAAYARLALVEGGAEGPGSRAPALGSGGGRLGPMIYVAAGAPERLAALTSAAGQGLIVLVVPTRTLVHGRPSGVRGPMLATLEVCGCRGFQVGGRREPDRVRAKEPSAA
ncbi:MAG: DUF58 domain-containing protein [Solirubrobacteraceae bacterium]